MVSVVPSRARKRSMLSASRLSALARSPRIHCATPSEWTPIASAAVEALTSRQREGALEPGVRLPPRRSPIPNSPSVCSARHSRCLSPISEATAWLLLCEGEALSRACRCGTRSPRRRAAPRLEARSSPAPLRRLPQSPASPPQDRSDATRTAAAQSPGRTRRRILAEAESEARRAGSPRRGRAEASPARVRQARAPNSACRSPATRPSPASSRRSRAYMRTVSNRR